MKKRRTAKQEWAGRRWQLKGNLTAARSMVFYHQINSPLTDQEYKKLERIRDIIDGMLRRFKSQGEETKPR